MSEISRGIDISTVSQIGRNRIDGVIGEGRTASVLSAFNTELNRSVAIKAITNPKYDRDAFEREVSLHTDLAESVPGIVSILDHGIVPVTEKYEVPYFVMDRADGSVMDVVATHGPLGIEKGATILGEAAGTIDAIHLQGLVHDDVHPRNLLLNKGTVWVADLGKAGTPTEPGEQRGLPTIPYAAPERLKGAVTPAGDQFSAAASLSEIAFGKRIIPKPKFGQYKLRILSPGYTGYLEHRLREVVPESLHEPFRKAMDPDPDKRFESIKGFTDEIFSRIRT